MTSSNSGGGSADAGTRPGRLSAATIEDNFADMHPPLDRSGALIEADRCYFCFDAPCTTACPTGIDIPGFIQAIHTDNLLGSAKKILDENIMGGMCARVCPTEVLCEQACVRNTHEDKPVNIGLLQRYATDPVFDSQVQLFERAPQTGKTIAVVGGGPAGLACAHRLATLGHEVTVLSRDDKLGGLNEYGIAAYKTVDDFAQKEVDYILGIGGIDARTNVMLGSDYTLSGLRKDYDAVFLGFGLNGVNDPGLDGENEGTVENAVDYIAALRQTEDKSSLPVGNRIVVIGGGMTAIDIAVQTKRLGAEDVTLVYRRGPQHMGASKYEQDFAQTNGVRIRHWARPHKLSSAGGSTEIEFERTQLAADGSLSGSGEFYALDADVVFKAIGQLVVWERLGDTAELLQTESGRIVVDENRRTSLENVWAGGDCIVGGEDLTVSAVQDGKLAAIDIDAYLRNAG